MQLPETVPLIYDYHIYPQNTKPIQGRKEYLLVLKAQKTWAEETRSSTCTSHAKYQMDYTL